MDILFGLDQASCTKATNNIRQAYYAAASADVICRGYAFLR